MLVYIGIEGIAVSQSLSAATAGGKAGAGLTPAHNIRFVPPGACRCFVSGPCQHGELAAVMRTLWLCHKRCISAVLVLGEAILAD